MLSGHLHLAEPARNGLAINISKYWARLEVTPPERTLPRIMSYVKSRLIAINNNFHFSVSLHQTCIVLRLDLPRLIRWPPLRPELGNNLRSDPDKNTKHPKFSPSLCFNAKTAGISSTENANLYVKQCWSSLVCSKAKTRVLKSWMI